jgi:glycosyltransferase involved in cell wall biosynthesis
MTECTKHVVMFATADWTSRYWTNSQHIAIRLAARGYRILFVETVGISRLRLNMMDAVRVARRFRKQFYPVNEVHSNIWVFSPLTIPGAHRSRIVKDYNDRQLRRDVGRWQSKQEAERPIVWTYHPFMLGVAETLDPSAIVYHCVDDVSALPGVDEKLYVEAERRLLGGATHIFTTSSALLDRCSAVAPERTHYFANVADVDHFARARSDAQIPPDLAAIPRPRLGYIGALSDFKLDINLLDSAVRQRDDWHWIFIGDEPEGQANPALARLSARPNVHMLGWRPYKVLPDYLRGIDVALLPQLINKYTRAMFPMKFFEYLAAGRPVVSTPLPALAEFQIFFRTAATAQELMHEIAAVLADPRRAVLPKEDPMLRAHSWEVRLEAMLAIIEGRAA